MTLIELLRLSKLLSIELYVWACLKIKAYINICMVLKSFTNLKQKFKTFLNKIESQLCSGITKNFKKGPVEKIIVII